MNFHGVRKNLKLLKRKTCIEVTRKHTIGLNERLNRHQSVYDQWLHVLVKKTTRISTCNYCNAVECRNIRWKPETTNCRQTSAMTSHRIVLTAYFSLPPQPFPCFAAPHRAWVAVVVLQFFIIFARRQHALIHVHPETGVWMRAKLHK